MDTLYEWTHVRQLIVIVSITFCTWWGLLVLLGRGAGPPGPPLATGLGLCSQNEVASCTCAGKFITTKPSNNLYMYIQRWTERLDGQWKEWQRCWSSSKPTLVYLGTLHVRMFMVYRTLNGILEISHTAGFRSEMFS